MSVSLGGKTDPIVAVPFANSQLEFEPAKVCWNLTYTLPVTDDKPNRIYSFSRTL